MDLSEKGNQSALHTHPRARYLTYTFTIYVYMYLNDPKISEHNKASEFPVETPLARAVLINLTQKSCSNRLDMKSRKFYLQTRLYLCVCVHNCLIVI